MTRILRKAHPVDIARHLANSPHAVASLCSITDGVGMGTAQLKLWDAVHAATAAGYITVADGGLVGMATLTDLGRQMASTDPEVHSIHLDTHTPLTIEPADTQMRCNTCSGRYEDGEWQLLLADAQNRDGNQFTVCLRCATAIASAVPQFPASPAPWVEY